VLLSRNGSLNFLEHSGPVPACNGTALPLPLCISLPSDIFSLDYLTKILYVYVIFTIHTLCPPHLILLDLIILTVFWGRVQVRKPLTVQLSAFAHYHPIPCSSVCKILVLYSPYVEFLSCVSYRGVYSCAAYVASCSLTLGPFLWVKWSSSAAAAADCLTLENGTDRLFHSISKHLPTYAV